MYTGQVYGYLLRRSGRQKLMSRTMQLSDDVPVSVTIVRAVAAEADLDPETVPVLQKVLDVDALDALVSPTRSNCGSEVVVRFGVADCVVEVSSEGTVSASSDATVDGERGPLEAEAETGSLEVAADPEVGVR